MDDDAFDDLALQRLSVPGHRAGPDVAAPIPAADRGRRRAGGRRRRGRRPMLDSARARSPRRRSARTDGVLVLVMLDGGNDGLNMVVPNGTPRYYELRDRIAIPQNQVLPLTTSTGLHPRLTRIKADVRPGQGRGRAGRRLPTCRPQPLHVDGHLDERLGRRQPARRPDRMDRALHGRPPERRQRVAARRRARQLGAPPHDRPGRSRVGLAARHRWCVRHRPLARSRTPGCSTRSRRSGAGPTGSGQWGDLIGKTERNTLDLAQRIQPAYQGDVPRERPRATSSCSRPGSSTPTSASGSSASTSAGSTPTRTSPTWHADLMGDLDASVGAFFDTLAATFKSPGDADDVLRVRPPTGGQRHQRHRPRHRRPRTSSSATGSPAGCTAPRRRSPRWTTTATWSTRSTSASSTPP